MILFHNTVNRKKLKAWKFQSHRLTSFSAIKGSVNWVEAVMKFVLFLSLFLYVNENFKYILSSHKIIFMKTVNLFSSIFQLVFLISKSIVFFFLKSFIHLMNMNKWDHSLAVPCFLFNFNSRKSKHTIIAFNL